MTIMDLLFPRISSWASTLVHPTEFPRRLRTPTEQASARPRGGGGTRRGPAPRGRRRRRGVSGPRGAGDLPAVLWERSEGVEEVMEVSRLGRRCGRMADGVICNG